MRQELEAAGHISFRQEAENYACLDSVPFLLFAQSLGQSTSYSHLAYFTSHNRPSTGNVCEASVSVMAERIEVLCCKRKN